MAKHKLRILLSTNAPWAPSGYGQQAAEILPRIKEAGFEVAASCFYGLEGNKIDWNGIPCYPKIGDTWGADATVNHALDFKADVVMTLQDLWVVDPNALRSLKRWVPIVPIDMEPPPASIIERLKMAWRIISYSKFGRDQLKMQGLHSTYIPHTVDTKIYKPAERKKIRLQVKIPSDIFLFGMVAANKDNPPRKSFQEVMDAFVVFHKRHPKSGLYLHTLLRQNGGFNIEEYAKFLGIEKSIYHLQPYEFMYKVDKAGMAKIYNSFDCLVAPSTSEGFGVPIIEAQSCGVPVITNNFTAMPEHIREGKTGYITDLLYKRFTPLGSYVGVPKTSSIYDKMEAVYRADRDKMAKACRRDAIKNYDSDGVFEDKWLPLLNKIEREVEQENGVDKLKANS